MNAVLSDIEDRLATARNLVECAFMACDALADEHRDPLATTLNTASEHLRDIGKMLDEVKARV